MSRLDGRLPGELRTITITKGFLQHPEGSVLVTMGETKVICTASVEAGVPPFLRGTGRGWVTAEYGMLPRATPTRSQRESTKGKPSGRSLEIQRLVGRSLRSVVDLDMIGEKTIWIDCDVIQADGGTRTASITGAFVALVDALEYLRRQGDLQKSATRNGGLLPVRDFLAAVSVGVVGGQPLLDLNFSEDSQAEVDMNVVGTGSGSVVEVQGTGEQKPFSREHLDNMLDMAQNGIERLIEHQREALGDLARLIHSHWE